MRNDDRADASQRLGMKGCVGVTALSLILAWAALLSSCVSRDEVARAISPDGGIVARVVEINGGATTDYLYTVNLQRNWLFPLWEYQVADLYGATRSDCAYGLDLRWLDDSTLAVEYLKATRPNVDRSVAVLGRNVSIVSKAGVRDEAAPCGGMLYNQQSN